MAITVIISRDRRNTTIFDTYSEGTHGHVTDGHLTISKPDRADWEPIAQYAPGQWVSWSKDDTRTSNETD